MAGEEGNDVLPVRSERYFAEINGRLIIPVINCAFVVCSAAFFEKAASCRAVSVLGEPLPILQTLLISETL